MISKQATSIFLLTPVFILLSHYLAVFPHEFAHSFMAWLLGLKEHPLAIDYGGTSWLNLLLLFHIDENVDYNTIYSLGKGGEAALIAFSGPGIANGLMYSISLFLLNNKTIRNHLYLYYFLFWFNFMNLANFYDYVPVRVFSDHGDMGHIAKGLNISPWYIYVFFGYLVAFVIWYFYTHTLIQGFKYLKINSLFGQASLTVISTLILFGYFGMAGFVGYGVISHFISATSLILIPGVIIVCWPTRDWIRRKLN